MPTTSESQRKAVKKYNAANTKSFTLCCNIKTDPDIIAFLEPIENKQAYLKALVRAEIARAKSEQPKEDKPMKTWYIIDYSNGDMDATNTGTADRETARKLLIRDWRGLSEHDRKLRREFYAALGEPDEDGLLDMNTVTDTIDIGSAQKYQVEYTDPDTGATSPIDTVRAKPCYTAEEYIDACRRNADPEWCEMLLRGTVTLTPID